MTTPRIGDTVHYTDANRTCFAAIITDTTKDEHGADLLGLHVISRNGAQYKRNVSPAPITGRGFSPGNWHHIH